MDKNNDIRVNKVDKWCEGVADVSLWRAKKSVDMFLCGYSSMLSIEALDAVRTIYVYLDEALDRFNELEARHQKDTGMISEYEEENRILRDQRKELVDARSELAKDNDNLRHERDRNAYLLDGLCRTLADKGICGEWSETALEWHLYGKNKLFDELREHYEEELRIREKEKDEKDKLINELNQKIKDLESKNRSLQIRINMVYGCYKSKDNALKRLCQEAAKLEKENKELKDALNVDRDLGKYVGKCVADCIQEGWKNGRYELHPYTRFDIHVEETKNTSMSSNRYSIPIVAVTFNNIQTEMERDTAQHECEELDKKVDRLWSVNEELNRKIKELKKENKELNMVKEGYDELEEKLKSAEDSIRTLQEFLEKCGVPVKYRNNDTWYWDFENSAWDDTLMKDCKLIDKCRELEKENNNLTTDNKRLSNAVEAWFDMFIGMRHKRDALKKENDNLKQTLLNILETLETKVGLRRIHLLDSYEDRANLIAVEIDRLLIKYEKLKEINKSCPVACECENFKPKVHHSYDPLDDLPDVDHS